MCPVSRRSAGRFPSCPQEWAKCKLAILGCRALPPLPLLVRYQRVATLWMVHQYYTGLWFHDRDDQWRLQPEAPAVCVNLTQFVRGRGEWEVTEVCEHVWVGGSRDRCCGHANRGPWHNDQPMLQPLPLRGPRIASFFSTRRWFACSLFISRAGCGNTAVASVVVFFWGEDWCPPGLFGPLEGGSGGGGGGGVKDLSAEWLICLPLPLCSFGTPEVAP